MDRRALLAGLFGLPFARALPAAGVVVGSALITTSGLGLKLGDVFTIAGQVHPDTGRLIQFRIASAPARGSPIRLRATI